MARRAIIIPIADQNVFVPRVTQNPKKNRKNSMMGAMHDSLSKKVFPSINHLTRFQ